MPGSWTWFWKNWKVIESFQSVVHIWRCHIGSDHKEVTNSTTNDCFFFLNHELEGYISHMFIHPSKTNHLISMKLKTNFLFYTCGYKAIKLRTKCSSVWFSVTSHWDEGTSSINTGHGVISSISIRIPRHVSQAVSDFDSHPHRSLGDSLATSSNLSCLMYVVIWSAVICLNVSNAINGKWIDTFNTIEGEIPSLTAIQAATNSVITAELDF